MPIQLTAFISVAVLYTHQWQQIHSLDTHLIKDGNGRWIHCASKYVSCTGRCFRGIVAWTTSKTHYSDVIMVAMASQITSLTIVYSTIYSGADQRKHQSSPSLAFVWGIHRWPVNSPHKEPVTRKMFPFDDVIMRYRSAQIIPVNWFIDSLGRWYEMISCVFKLPIVKLFSTWAMQLGMFELGLVLPCSNKHNFAHKAWRQRLCKRSIQVYFAKNKSLFVIWK